MSRRKNLRRMSHRTMSTAVTVVAMLALTVLNPSAAGAQEMTESVSISVQPASSSVILGDNLDLQVTVANISAEQTLPLVVHLDITDPGRSTSVDPEDWTPTLSKPIGTLAAGETVVVDWNIQPISPGTFATYAVALSPDADSVSSSNVLRVTVADQRSLNPGGILPVAIGAPAVIGGLLLIQILLARRTRTTVPVVLRGAS